ncbi:hypothetical protein PGTUg99_004504 [Puccinia graminis f. sp. tritici]|uniref:Uncharacterized protein n=1 Tax=Puccinia graminis f. sp. tritici TaxID=56615 RepID=A0A5B0RYV3_PUCGR|nr:hypothetical protein PGTUg99_004504 [Puccinia graminis f. sp. tritici]
MHSTPDSTRVVMPRMPSISRPSSTKPISSASSSSSSFIGLELVILLRPLVSLPNLSSGLPLPTGSLPPGLPPPLGHNPNVLAKKRQIAKDAVQILRNSIGVALHSLSIPINPAGVGSDTSSGASEEQIPALTPIQLSKLLSIIISDTPIPSTEDGKEPELLWTPTVQRATVLAIVSRVGQELTSQIANHCLADAKFTSNASPIALLYQICSDPVICSADLCKTVSEVESLKLTYPDVYLRAKTVLIGENYKDVYLSTIVGDPDKDAENNSKLKDANEDGEDDLRVVFPAIKSDDDLILREIRRRKKLAALDAASGQPAKPEDR